MRLLPEEFRGDYGREIERTFRAERRDARDRVSVTRLWFATIADLFRTAPSQHLDILVRDVRYALRMMAARPLHTTTAVFTLALGIGANVAMFAVVDGVLLSPLPYRDPGRLVSVTETEEGGDPSNVGYLTFLDLRERSRSFESMAAVGYSSATLTGPGQDAERVNGMRVSQAYFDMLGTPTALGRTFTEAEDRPGDARRVAIISDALWRRRFAEDPSVVGRPIEVNGLPITIVGVMPRTFEDLVSLRMYEGAEIWFPLGYDPAASFACRTCRHLRLFGRLAPGVTADQAERDLSAILRTLEAKHPTQYNVAAAEVTRLEDVFLGPVRPVLLVLWAAVGVLLLVACSNVANLLLLRASERSHEVAVRAALGVTRGRLARQLLTESLMLAVVAGAVGLVPAWAAIELLGATGPAELPRLGEVGLDIRAVAAALALTTASGLFFGLIPLRQLLRRDVSSTLHGSGRRTESVATWRVRAALVAGNVALAGLLLVGSGLLVRSLTSLLAVEPGFNPQGVLTMEVALSGAQFRDRARDEQIAMAVRFYDDVLTRIRALPGVVDAAGVTMLPMGGNIDGYGLHIQGRPLANPQESPETDRFVVTPGYFTALRIPLLRGRLLDERDTQNAEKVAVVNRTLADSLFPGEDPIGHRISLGPPTADARTIVGVVGDVRHHGLHVPVGPQTYVPHPQWAWAETLLVLTVRAEGNAASLTRPIREIVRAVDPAQPVTNVRLYDDVVASAIGTRRFAAWLLTAFAGTALVLAVVGLYGALGVVVGMRRREIGVRLALGARHASIRRMILGQGLRPVAVGLAIGLLAAAGLGGALQSLLFEVPPLDLAAFASAAAVLLVAASAACLLPAWRAARTNPAVTLRAE